MCACGCRGWCTLFPLLMALAVDLLACAMGGYLHVPKELLMPGVDANKYSVLAFVIAVIEMRTDWPAWCEVVGVRHIGQVLLMPVLFPGTILNCNLCCATSCDHFT